jgi:hypothetical protein
MTALNKLGAVEIARSIREGHVSPSDVMAAHLHRIEARETDVGAFQHLDAEAAILETKQVVLLAAKQWNDTELGILDAALLLIVLERAAVEECVLFARVPMQVAEQGDLALAVHVSDQVFCVEDRRMQQPVGLLPLAVQVAAKQRAPIVSEDDTIRVQHGNNPYDEMLA